MRHHTDESIDEFENRKMLSIRMVEGWIRHFLVKEKERMKYCQQRMDEIFAMRVDNDTLVLKREWMHRQTQKGEHKATIRGIELVLDAWPGFCRKLFAATEAKGL